MAGTGGALKYKYIFFFSLKITFFPNVLKAYTIYIRRRRGKALYTLQDCIFLFEENRFYISGARAVLKTIINSRRVFYIYTYV